MGPVPEKKSINVAKGWISGRNSSQKGNKGGYFFFVYIVPKYVGPLVW